MHRLAIVTPLASTLSVLLAAQLACGYRSDRASFEVIDSAGITIVVNDAALSSISQWQAEPYLTIGEVDGPQEYAFGHIADVDADSRGRILVLDRQQQRAAIYDAHGSYLFPVGAPGEGPGELSAEATAIGVGPSDSIAILDFSQRRLNVYTPAGDPARTVPMRFGRPGPYDFHWLHDGRLLTRWFTYNLDSDGRFVPWDALLLSDPAQAAFDTVMEFRYRRPEVGDLNRVLRPLITNAAFYDVLADGAIIWSALEGEQLAIHNLDGSLRRIVRNVAWRRRALRATERAALEALYRARSDASVGPIPDNVVFPDNLPTITAVRGSPDGGFWVQRMGRLADTDPEALFVPVESGWLGGSEWEVYDSDGRWYRTVVVPRRFRLMRIGDSTVIGVRRDTLDVERVVVLRVRH